MNILVLPISFLALYKNYETITMHKGISWQWNVWSKEQWWHFPSKEIVNPNKSQKESTMSHEFLGWHPGNFRSSLGMPAGHRSCLLMFSSSPDSRYQTILKWQGIWFNLSTISFSVAGTVWFAIMSYVTSHHLIFRNV